MSRRKTFDAAGNELKLVFRNAPPLVLYILDLTALIHADVEGMATALDILACRMLGRPSEPDELSPKQVSDWARRYVENWVESQSGVDLKPARHAKTKPRGTQRKIPRPTAGLLSSP